MEFICSISQPIYELRIVLFSLQTFLWIAGILGISFVLMPQIRAYVSQITTLITGLFGIIGAGIIAFLIFLHYAFCI